MTPVLSHLGSSRFVTKAPLYRTHPLIPSLLFTYLQDDGGNDEHSDAVHYATEVGEESLAAAPRPDVEFLNTVVVVVVGGVIGQVMLDAGPGGAGVTAAERDTIHQVLSLHVTQHSTAGEDSQG